VQKLLGICSHHLEKGETHQGPAVLGIALIAMAEELGLEMAVRSLERLLQYGEQNIRRAVPLALGILCISNPKVTSLFYFRAISILHDLGITSNVPRVPITELLIPLSYVIFCYFFLNNMMSFVHH
jgi:hypothetical protein